MVRAEVEVISSSRSVKNPDSRGKVVTSNWSSGGKMAIGITHSAGIESLSAWRFVAAIDSHDMMKGTVTRLITNTNTIST